MTNSQSHTSSESDLKQMIAKRGFELVSVERQLPDGRIEAQAYKLQPIPIPSRDSLHVPVPVTLKITLDKDGHIQNIEGGTPDPDRVADAVKSVKTLIDNQQLAEAGQNLLPGATHQIEIDEKGRHIVRRRRFSTY